MNLVSLRELRQRLAVRLKALLKNPVIEEKELAAFDLVMSRREFLKASQLATVSALVMAGVPPTVWAKTQNDPALKVCPGDVGLTAGEQASVGVAAQLLTGTELFQDSVYAQPLVAPAAVGSHAVIEGARWQHRIQSSLESQNPDEFQFLDTQYHYGHPELVQLENDPTKGWELVHYRHPWTKRIDGARTDGLVRDVVASGLQNPARVLAVTSGDSNHFTSEDGQPVSSVRYLIYVEGTGKFFVGYGTSSVAAPYDAQRPYSVRWAAAEDEAIFQYMNGFPGESAFLFADTLTSSAWQSFADNRETVYVPAQQVEHVILYYKTGIGILTLQDFPQEASGGPVAVGVLATWLPLPSGAPPGLRVVHIDWDPQAADNSFLLNVVLAGTQTQSNGDVTYHLYTINHAGNITKTFFFGSVFSELQVRGTGNELNENFQHRATNIAASALNNGERVLDYSTVRSVKGLHTTIVDGNWYHIKLANFEGRGACLFGITKEGAPDDVHSTSAFFPGGHFPLAFPDAAGLGTITHLSGGTSKFGGFRFFACDSDANLFLLRQRSYEAADTPYKPPIYAQYTATGTLQTSWSGTPLPLPASTSPTSNLQDLQAWVDASAPGGNYVYNFLADAALAFATDDTSTSQAIWLGNTYQAAYALNRFSLDSEYVAVQKAQGSTDTYAAYAVFQEPVTRTWRERLIAMQVLSQGPGLQETGDHYQATITPANVYGKPVSLLASGNENLLIEVRADSPCAVVDDTNNFYYDVDRYTSFVAPPDPSSGRLSLLVKADVFSQVLYVRLVDASGLQPSSDTALLSSSAATVYPWQSTNLALEAQQRMGNGAPPSSLLGDSMPLADTTVYVSSDTLAASNQATPWQTKGGYQPSASNLSSVADYLNSSGQNLISATGQLSLGAPNANGAIDPLYAVTAVPSDPQRDTVTTAFGYAMGSVATTRTAPSLVLSGAPLGSIWGSISHALHDALHWLQNVEGEVYNDLGSGAVTLVSAVDGITATVSKEIMQQVNGVEQDLNEVVSTVEEYASVVANVIVTIVEQSFIVKYIELLIALISLFLHFEDMLALSKSLRGFFDDLFTGQGSVTLPQIPGSFSSKSYATQYLGPNNSLSSTMQGVDSSNVASELVTTIVDGVLENPLTKKILNKALSLISEVLNETNPPLPFSFQLNQDAAADAIDQITGLTSQLAEAVAGMSVDVATQLVNDLAGDLANPQATYQTLGSQLGAVVEGVATEALDEMFTLVDQIAVEGPTLAHELISSDPYLTINTTALSDLCKLFGIGNVVGSKLQVSSAEAVFLPLAVIAWVAVYMQEGKSINSVGDLEGNLSLPTGALGSVDTTRWNYIRIVVDGVIQELIGFVWLVRTGSTAEEQQNGAWAVFLEIGSLFGIARWANEITFASYKWTQAVPTSVQYFDFAVIAARLFTAVVDAALILSDKNNGDGWATGQPKPTDITQLINSLVQIGYIGVDTYGSITTGGDIPSLVGVDVFRTQIFLLFIYNFFSLESLLEVFTLGVFGTPAIGAMLQIIALSLSSTPPGTGGPGNGRGCGRGPPTDHTPGSGRGPPPGRPPKGPRS